MSSNRTCSGYFSVWFPSPLMFRSRIEITSQVFGAPVGWHCGHQQPANKRNQPGMLQTVSAKRARHSTAHRSLLSEAQLPQAQPVSGKDCPDGPHVCWGRWCWNDHCRCISGNFRAKKLEALLLQLLQLGGEVLPRSSVGELRAKELAEVSVKQVPATVLFLRLPCQQLHSLLVECLKVKVAGAIDRHAVCHGRCGAPGRRKLTGWEVGVGEACLGRRCAESVM